MQRGRVWINWPNYLHNCIGENIQRGIVWVNQTKSLMIWFNRRGSILFCLKCEEEVIYNVSFGRVWAGQPKLQNSPAYVRTLNRSRWCALSWQVRTLLIIF
jgi:hypothetical protein